MSYLRLLKTSTLIQKTVSCKMVHCSKNEWNWKVTLWYRHSGQVWMIWIAWGWYIGWVWIGFWGLRMKDQDVGFWILVYFELWGSMMILVMEKTQTGFRDLDELYVMFQMSLNEGYRARRPEVQNPIFHVLVWYDAWCIGSLRVFWWQSLWLVRTSF